MRLGLSLRTSPTLPIRLLHLSPTSNQSGLCFNTTMRPRRGPFAAHAHAQHPRASPRSSAHGPLRDLAPRSRTPPCFDLLVCPDRWGLCCCRRGRMSKHIDTHTYVPAYEAKLLSRNPRHDHPQHHRHHIQGWLFSTLLGPLPLRLRLVPNPHMRALAFRCTIAEVRNGGDCSAQRVVRILGRPESPAAGLAAQYRSVPVVTSALAAAASCGAMCAQPRPVLRFIRKCNDAVEAVGRKARDAVDCPCPGLAMSMPPILRVSGRPNDEQLPLPLARGPLGEPSHRTRPRRHRAGCRVQSRRLQPKPAQPSPAQPAVHLALCLVLSLWQAH